MTTERLDVLAVQRGLAASREQAQRLIRAGQVFLGGQRAIKPGHRVDAAAVLSVRERPRFVSRGGDKLEGAFAAFGLDVKGLVCLDVGASTGGFTDCLLQHGAARVYAVDVGKGQLHWKLRQDPRVVTLERLNARYLGPEHLPERPRFAVIDVSFISLTKILPAVVSIMEPSVEAVSLIKPQFELGPEHVARGGVVRDEQKREQAVEAIRRFGTERLGLAWLGVCASPLRGPAGNVEFLAHWRMPGPDAGAAGREPEGGA